MKCIKFKILLLLVLITSVISAKEYHVSVNGNDKNDGSVTNPFRTINFAAQLAVAGDVITVHAGTYRERINPARGGESDTKRIVYRAAWGEKVEIKGSEIITGWKKEKTGVWSVTIPNSFFGDYNPYRDSIFGDWFNNHGRIHHTGEVFLNGKSLYEKEILEKVISPVADQKIKDTEGSTFTWFCRSDNSSTTIWANFHQYNPNKELIEISVRPTVFYPSKPGLNYITISGFHISQAATQWGAPTAEQVGMIATHWNKGWIIENNVISDSKCSGITLGKERGTGHNVWSNDIGNVNNDGNIHYIEVTFRVLRNGWNKENTGSHIVRNNTIFNCEQTGICGSMGGAFCTVENNHIYNIWTKRQFSGAEIGGIKFHAAIDTQIRNNRIHSCGRGLWLDWMTQGTRVSSNLFYDNDMEDIFLEVNHGPFIVDNNILLSLVSLRTQSEGGAYLHNLITGVVQMWPDLNRFTPYFLPHSTDMRALTTILSGDDRFYNNIFVGPGDKTSRNNEYKHGLESYNKAKLPVWMSGNVYYNAAKPSDKDLNALNNSTFNPGVKLMAEGESGYLFLTYVQSFYNHQVQMITTELLGKAKISKAAFDNPDGTPLKIDMDFFGKKRSDSNLSAGPFENPGKGEIKLKVW
ncbi:MAG TPA: right-handed parallel beta-helix repeat-containing protein [Prolixibacteraceae bacterium]|nr:right-handed parallel beta-helix repeat-containing protein [Prolixibacteraceae bacterium]